MPDARRGSLQSVLSDSDESESEEDIPGGVPELFAVMDPLLAEFNALQASPLETVVLQLMRRVEGLEESLRATWTTSSTRLESLEECCRHLQTELHAERRKSAGLAVSLRAAEKAVSNVVYNIGNLMPADRADGGGAQRRRMSQFGVAAGAAAAADDDEEGERRMTQKFGKLGAVRLPTDHTVAHKVHSAEDALAHAAGLNLDGRLQSLELWSQSARQQQQQQQAAAAAAAEEAQGRGGMSDDERKKLEKLATHMATLKATVARHAEGVKQTLEQSRGTLTDLQRRVVGMDKRLGAVDAALDRCDAVEETAAALGQRVDAVESRFDAVNDEAARVARSLVDDLREDVQLQERDHREALGRASDAAQQAAAAAKKAAQSAQTASAAASQSASAAASAETSLSALSEGSESVAAAVAAAEAAAADAAAAAAAQTAAAAAASEAQTEAAAQAAAKMEAAAAAQMEAAAAAQAAAAEAAAEAQAAAAQAPEPASAPAPAQELLHKTHHIRRKSSTLRLLTRELEGREDKLHAELSALEARVAAQTAARDAELHAELAQLRDGVESAVRRELAAHQRQAPPPAEGDELRAREQELLSRRDSDHRQLQDAAARERAEVLRRLEEQAAEVAKARAAAAEAERERAELRAQLEQGHGHPAAQQQQQQQPDLLAEAKLQAVMMDVEALREEFAGVGERVDAVAGVHAELLTEAAAALTQLADGAAGMMALPPQQLANAVRPLAKDPQAAFLNLNAARMDAVVLRLSALPQTKKTNAAATTAAQQMRAAVLALRALFEAALAQTALRTDHQRLSNEVVDSRAGSLTPADLDQLREEVHTLRTLVHSMKDRDRNEALVSQRQVRVADQMAVGSPINALKARPLQDVQEAVRRLAHGLGEKASKSDVVEAMLQVRTALEAAADQQAQQVRRVELALQAKPDRDDVAVAAARAAAAAVGARGGGGGEGDDDDHIAGGVRCLSCQHPASPRERSPSPPPSSSRLRPQSAAARLRPPHPDPASPASPVVSIPSAPPAVATPSPLPSVRAPHVVVRPGAIEERQSRAQVRAMAKRYGQLAVEARPKGPNTVTPVKFSRAGGYVRNKDYRPRSAAR